ncbi:iron-containing alcohol dehydrogenase [Pseudotabrizicola algicola]|uniref:Iron-containing alcohol dehydrogenase n=1 Tax=Pseudotabrizicola algicola TaxID=2709381 RepID=A0A6B3RSE1_9RHOB|nr:iron-containing alcohol dehydrogenase [Pseudotabrizicola algicola]NEX47728.1 iron-containing alcohol dehydrogenase [Pseudotabrizicola algicola]
MSFAIHQPPQILFGRGRAAEAAKAARAFGPRGVVVHGRDPARAAALLAALGPGALALPCPAEPSLPMLEDATQRARAHRPDWVLAIGGGAVLDLGKALAAMIPAPGEALDHLEVVGKGLPLVAAPLPFIAVPTTAGTGAEVTRNAVIGLPDHHVKVSLRDMRMIARVAIVDPALTDHCPWPVTLASGLDAVAQVIEPYVSIRATPYSDAIAEPVIETGLRALMRLQAGEDAAARDALAWTSLCGGLALANAGLGVVHGFAAGIGGATGAAHGAICGALLGPVLAMNRARATGEARRRLDHVCGILARVLGGAPDEAPMRLADWAHGAGLPRLSALGVTPEAHARFASRAQGASSTKGNPVTLSHDDLCTILERAG